MKPYTILVFMKNSDVLVYDGWAKDTQHARDIITDMYAKNGWLHDVKDVVIHPNRIRKNAGFYQIRQIAGAGSEATC